MSAKAKNRLSKELDDVLRTFPEETRQILKLLWQGLPADVRRELDLTLTTVYKLVSHTPGAGSDLLQLVQRVAAPALSPLGRVAIVGPVNVGKSTLYNALLGQARAEVSPVPGTTREAQGADLGVFHLVDTPGADHGANVGIEEKEKAFKAATAADFLVVVFDASRSVLASDRVLYGELAALGKPVVVALNKMDLVEQHHRLQVIASAAQVLGLETEAVLPVSATRGWGLDRLVLEVSAAEPRLLGRLGQFLVPLRRKLAWQAIRRATVAAVLVALLPLPVVDLVPLSLIQASMVLTLARIYEQEVSAARAGEMLATLGGGLAARALFEQLARAVPLAGWALAASIAGSATLAMGYAARRWFETGRRPTRREIAELAREVQGRLVRRLTALGRRKPSRQRLTRELEESLPELTRPLEEQEGPTPQPDGNSPGGG